MKVGIKGVNNSGTAVKQWRNSGGGTAATVVMEKARALCGWARLRAGIWKKCKIMEKDIERKLKKRLEGIGCLCLKFESPGYTGVPDRIVLAPGGRIAFVETKAPGKKERPRQVYVQNLFRAQGAQVFSGVDSLEKIEKVVEWCKSR